MEDLKSFEEDLKALLGKHNKIIFAVPCYVRDDKGVWTPSAELKWADAPPEPKTEAKK